MAGVNPTYREILYAIECEGERLQGLVDSARCGALGAGKLAEELSLTAIGIERGAGQAQNWSLMHEIGKPALRPEWAALAGRILALENQVGGNQD